ncbi:ion transporter [Roseobacter denitrificans]|uniref:Voltage-gated sodium channel subunit n=2 Tax=Roseobacter denitrificans TaxID=2434 RepID=Q16D22_ROSDO|nr:ion transporter [Roseobacter denitrificans]ABG30121.1 voltage-gated sodium channel subunit [Roseobacter denitrificans OCh 114]AVL53314.1 ion transporter [Roseobacter denitrificans]SFF69799.1 voltage-gated sodium channel [Roseobacter denitrificans OCh 114]
MGVREQLDIWLDNRWVTNLVIAVIIFNAILLGMETSPQIMAEAGDLIIMLDKACLTFFVVEIFLKLVARGRRFFKSGWNIFDVLIVGAALVPGSQTMSVLRALRILRVLRVISVAPSLRRVVEGFVTALPGMGSVFVLMAIIFYIGSVISTKLFAASFPQWFGSLPQSGYTLFQIMTLESWSMGIVRPVMEVYPFAWMFFIPFIMMTTFAVVNLLVGLIVNSMQDAHQQEAGEQTDAYRDEVLSRLIAIEEKLKDRPRS